VKLRSRVAAIAAAAGLAAGLVVVGGGVAHAETVVLDCDHIGSSAAAKPGIAKIGADTVVGTKGPLKAGIDPLKPVTAAPKACTGALAATVGDLTKVAGKLAGSASCDLLNPVPTTDPLKPLSGTVTLTFSNQIAPPLNIKLWSSTLFIRTGQGPNPGSDPGDLPDEIVIKNGIDIKGAGVGADVSGGFLFAPYSTLKADWDSNPATPIAILADQSHLDANGDMVGGTGSQILGLQCTLGLSVLDKVFLATDGQGILGGTVDHSLHISLPDDA